jgi:hypothetical protein
VRFVLGNSCVALQLTADSSRTAQLHGVSYTKMSAMIMFNVEATPAWLNVES